MITAKSKGQLVNAKGVERKAFVKNKAIQQKCRLRLSCQEITLFLLCMETITILSVGIGKLYRISIHRISL